ncbi:penicillin-binding protein 1C [Ekhidna sp.]|uniref:penicillin-binding protein 1C n=1 Tax=Ekhidna sp. TaxID=2608089 RepID=UPI003BAB66BE
MSRLFKLNRTKKSLLFLFLGIGFIFFIYPLNEPRYSYSTVLNDRNGNLLAATIAKDGQWRFPEPDSIAQKLKLCIQYFEDRHFYKHPGVNPLAIGRAAIQNVRAGKVVSGASTLTMQIARMMRGRDRTVWQKLIEIGLAIKLELKYSKKALMTKYLSMAPFGGNVVGIEAASWRYFNRPPHLLSWGESAALAVLPNNPGAIYPGRSNAQYLTKRNRLLETLKEHQIIDQRTYELSLLEELPEKPYPIPQKAPHLLTTIQETNPESIIQSTLDPFWQSRATQILERHHAQQMGNGVDNLATIVIDLQTAKVLAYIGNTSDPKAEGYQVDIIQKSRSPGSSLKPILYAHALSEGEILPETLLPDIPTFFGGFSPKNFSGGYEGAIPANQALAKSLNIPFTYMLRDHSYEKFHFDLKKLGISTLDNPPGHYGLSMILGGADVKMWDLANVYVKMYQSLAGILTRDISYTSNSIQSEKVNLDPAAIWCTFDAMTELSRPSEEQEWRSFSSSQLISWKTGTSFGFRDAWAVGLNGNVFVGVWVGNADGEGRAGLTGINAAAPVLLELMRLADHDRNWLEKLKPRMKQMMICTKSGMIANALCPSEQKMVPLNAENSGVCTYHQEFQMDKSLTFRVNSSCYSLAESVPQTHFVLPPSMGYYYSKTHADYNGIPQLFPSCKAGTRNPIEIIYPNANSRVFIPLTLDGEKGRIVLEASHQNVSSTLFWSIGEEFYGKTSSDHQLEVFLSKGMHVLRLTDEKGNERRVTFEVISES